MTVRQRFECTECGNGSLVEVDTADVDTKIRYVCEECEKITEQNPEGWTDWFRDLN